MTPEQKALAIQMNPATTKTVENTDDGKIITYKLGAEKAVFNSKTHRVTVTYADGRQESYSTK